MKMFMATLEEHARSWYERLPLGCIYSLVDFHMMFYENFKEEHPSLLLVKDCCKQFQGFIHQLESVCGAVTRVFFTSSYFTLQVNPGAFCYCKGHLNLRLFVRIMLRSIDLKNTRVNGS